MSLKFKSYSCWVSRAHTFPLFLIPRERHFLSFSRREHFGKIYFYSPRIVLNQSTHRRKSNDKSFSELQMNGNLYGGYNTIDNRSKSRSRSLVRKTNYQSQIFDPMPIYANSLYRSELVHTIINCSEGSGICLGPAAPNGRGFIITHVIPDSTADRWVTLVV